MIRGSSSDVVYVKSNNWTAEIERWNLLIRDGQADLVRDELDQLETRPRDIRSCVGLANIAFRVNLPRIGLRALFPKLRRDSQLRIDSNAEAYCAYAACLLEIGSIFEAKKILSQIGTRAPAAPFFMAFLALKEWDYKSAFELLTAYEVNVEKDSYHHLVVLVNLASCLVQNRQWEEAKSLLAKLKLELESSSRNLLLGNCLEIESQIYIQTGDIAQARILLKASENHLRDSKNMSWIYCRKWGVICDLMESNNDSLIREKWESVRAMAIRMSSWETVRELDLYWSLLTKDSNLLNRVYFGSPIVNYRTRVLEMAQHYKMSECIGDSYLWTNADSNSEADIILASEDLIGTNSSLVKGEAVKKLMGTLMTDFYAPFRVGQLFGLIYPKDYFDLDSSPDRVYQLIKRLKLALAGLDANLSVSSEGDSYRLVIGYGAAIKITTRAYQNVIELEDRRLTDIRQIFGDRTFSANEISDALQCSNRTSNRIIKDLVQSGTLITIGRTRNARYKIAG